MKKFKIADLVVSMEPNFSPLLPQSKEYLYNGNDESICKITTPQEVLDSYKARFPETDDSLIEYMHTGTVFYKELIHHNGMLIHSSAVEMDGKAYFLYKQ